MIFRAFFLLGLAQLATSPAAANPFAHCPEAFERMFPSEVATHEIPSLSFMADVKARFVQQAERTLVANRKNTSYKIIPQLANAVNVLQVERRALFGRLDQLRQARRLEKTRGLNYPAGSESARLSRVKKAELDTQIEAIQQNLTALTAHLVPLRNQLGRITIEAAATLTAAETDTLILLRNTLINAAGQLTHKGVGKGLSVKFHSASEGVIAGLIPYQQRLSAKVAAKGPEEIAKMQKLVDEALASGSVVKFKFRVGPLVAVEHEGEVKFVNITRERVDDKDIVEVIGVFDEEWLPRLLTSDVDPLAFGRRSELLPEIPYSSKEKGLITPTEREVIRTYNRQAAKLLGRDIRTFMAHGAENRNPHSTGISGYPITVHFPDGRMKVIEKGPAEDPDRHLKAFFVEAQAEGFHLDVNPLWGWPEDLAAPAHGTAEN